MAFQNTFDENAFEIIRNFEQTHVQVAPQCIPAHLAVHSVRKFTFSLEVWFPACPVVRKSQSTSPNYLLEMPKFSSRGACLVRTAYKQRQPVQTFRKQSGQARTSMGYLWLKPFWLKCVALTTSPCFATMAAWRRLS
jgi:hypothetical protein